MIRILRHIHDRYPVRRIVKRTGAMLALCGFLISLAILLSGCACQAGEAYCPPAFTSPRL